MNLHDMYNLLSKEELIKLVIDKDEEITRWFEHKTTDNRTIQDQSDLIDELKAKLAEKEERINWWVEAEFNRKWAKKYVEMRRKEDPMLCLPDSDEVYERYFELKQQLAEKERTITNLVEDNRASQEWYKKQLTEKEKEIEKVKEVNLDVVKKQIEFYKDQDKISFALEQLKETQSYVDNQCFMARYKSERKAYAGVWNYIDNQIKQLKGGK